MPKVGIVMGSDSDLKVMSKAAAMLEKAQVDPAVIRALVLNIRYDGEKTVLTTGCAYQIFTMDKSADTAWDKALKKYLEMKGISYEEL